MDNICHTLVGATLARTGLGRRTALGGATMMIGANFPDIDILAAPFGRATEFRRGWTHGVLAMVVLPFVLAGVMLAWSRFRRGRGKPAGDAADARQLLILSAISIWTHPTLDWMNSYGLRWLMPFDGTWFYGDSLFIIDPYLLAILGTAVWLSRRRERTSLAASFVPARIGAALATLYIVSMLLLQDVAEGLTRGELAGTGRHREKLVVTASPANPLRWRVHADDGARYSTGSANPVTRTLVLDAGTIEKGAEHIAVASSIPAAAPFLDWARLPVFRLEQQGTRSFIRITDARYGASVLVPVHHSR